jgi:uncharacterized protein (TIGR00369 family)
MDEDWLRTLKEFGVGALAETMGIEVTIEDGTVVGRMPVLGNTQPYGILHGGATAVLVETVGSIAAGLSARGRLPMGIELSVSHHRSTSTGSVHARAQAVQEGRTLASYVIPVFDDEDRRIATGRLTCLLRDATP